VLHQGRWAGESRRPPRRTRVSGCWPDRFPADPRFHVASDATRRWPTALQFAGTGGLTTRQLFLRRVERINAGPGCERWIAQGSGQDELDAMAGRPLQPGGIDGDRGMVQGKPDSPNLRLQLAPTVPKFRTIGRAIATTPLPSQPIVVNPAWGATIGILSICWRQSQRVREGPAPTPDTVGLPAEGSLSASAVPGRSWTSSLCATPLNRRCFSQWTRLSATGPPSCLVSSSMNHFWEHVDRAHD
jgi:hypothetical protein